MGRILVVVGMEDERAIAAGDDIDVVVGAANAKRLRERLGNVDTATVDAVYSFGVAGGLDPALKAGDLRVSTRVVAQRVDGERGLAADSWRADGRILTAIQVRAARVDALNVRASVFLGTDIEARDNDLATLEALRKASGARCVDNESHIAAAFAAERGLPFVSVRAISDSVYTELPPAALLPLNAKGRPDIAAIVISLLRHPRQLPAILRTARDYRQALEALRAFRDGIGFIRPSG